MRAGVCLPVEDLQRFGLGIEAEQDAKEVRLAVDRNTDSGGIMSIDEQKTTRPDSRWRAELRNLYRSAESNRGEATDEKERHYQLGVMTACRSIWNRVTGEQLV